MKHRHVLLSDEVKRKYNLNEREISAAATLPELDDAYTRKVHNFTSAHDMYKWSSCINYLHNIDRPVIFLNALDDPLVPELLLPPIRKFVGKYTHLSNGLDSNLEQGLIFTISIRYHPMQSLIRKRCTSRAAMEDIWASMRADLSIRIPLLGWIECLCRCLAASLSHTAKSQSRNQI